MTKYKSTLTFKDGRTMEQTYNSPKQYQDAKRFARGEVKFSELKTMEGKKYKKMRRL